MHVWVSQGLPLTWNEDWGFLLSTSLPTCGIITQPHCRVLCPVRRPATTLHCVVLKDSNRIFVARLGPEINFRVCLCALQAPRHITKCWLSTQRWILFQISLLKFCRAGSGPTNFWIKPPLASPRWNCSAGTPAALKCSQYNTTAHQLNPLLRISTFISKAHRLPKAYWFLERCNASGKSNM